MSRTWYAYEQSEDSTEGSEEESCDERDKEKKLHINLKKRKRLSIDEQIKLLASLACMQCGELCDSNAQLQSHQSRVHCPNTPPTEHQIHLTPPQTEHHLVVPAEEMTASSTFSGFNPSEVISATNTCQTNSTPYFTPVSIEKILASSIENRSNINSVENNNNLLDKVSNECASPRESFNEKQLVHNQNILINPLVNSSRSLSVHNTSRSENISKSSINSYTIDKLSKRQKLSVNKKSNICIENRNITGSPIQLAPIKKSRIEASVITKLNYSCGDSEVSSVNPIANQVGKQSVKACESIAFETSVVKSKTNEKSPKKNQNVSKPDTNQRISTRLAKSGVTITKLCAASKATKSVVKKGSSQSATQEKKIGNMAAQHSAAIASKSKRKSRRMQVKLPLQVKLPVSSSLPQTQYTKPLRVRTNHLNHECRVCLKKFITPSKLARHMKSHTGEKQSKCKYCEKLFSREDNLYIHVMNVHKRLREFKCTNCNKKFITKRGLRYHKVSCTLNNNVKHQMVKNYFCDFCMMSFIHKNSVRNHISRIHMFENEYLCVLCKKSFSTTYHIRRHFYSVHKKIRSFRCAHCMYRCSDKANLVFHYLSNHAKK